MHGLLLSFWKQQILNLTLKSAKDLHGIIFWAALIRESAPTKRSAHSFFLRTRRTLCHSSSARTWRQPTSNDMSPQMDVLLDRLDRVKAAARFLVVIRTNHFKAHSHLRFTHAIDLRLKGLHYTAPFMLHLLSGLKSKSSVILLCNCKLKTQLKIFCVNNSFWAWSQFVIMAILW